MKTLEEKIQEIETLITKKRVRLFNLPVNTGVAGYEDDKYTILHHEIKGLTQALEILKESEQ